MMYILRKAGERRQMLEESKVLTSCTTLFWSKLERFTVFAYCWLPELNITKSLQVQSVVGFVKSEYVIG